MENRAGKTPNPAEMGITPILVSRFDTIKEKPDIAPELSSFESILNTEDFRKHSFEEIREAFLFIFNEEKIRQYLTAREQTQEAFRYLKRVRRFGLILRSNYILLNATHRPPESLYRFLSLLGDYNDHYWLDKKQNADPLLETLDGINKLDLAIKMADDREFKKYVDDVLNRIDSLIEKGELPVAEFHELRKNIRSCADLLQVAATENYGGGIHWLFSSVLALSIRLGEQHDELLQKGLRKEIDYGEASVLVDPAIRQEFEKLKPFIKRVVGIS